MHTLLHHAGRVAGCYAAFWDMRTGHHALRADDAIILYHALFQYGHTIAYPNTISYNDIITSVYSFVSIIQNGMAVAGSDNDVIGE